MLTVMSPAEIKEFAEKIDWDKAFLAEPGYSDLSYRRKQDRREFLITVRTSETMENRWGPTSIRRFLNALIVPRVDKTYDAVFGLTPEEFDAVFRQYAERRFRPVVR